MKPLMGTGKWKGMTGSMKTARLRTGKAIEKGTYQMCFGVKGVYNLPE